MPKKTIEELLFVLHEKTDVENSPQQAQLMTQLQQNLHDLDSDAVENASMVETVELLLEEFSDEHPQASAVAKDILRVLQDIGV